MLFDAGFALTLVPKIAGALWTSILVALLSCIGASLLGFGLEIARRSNRVMRYAMRFLIDFIRSTPLLVQLYFFYFVLPSYGIKLPALAIGVIAISIYYSGYLAEVFKAGIDGVKPGQFEAARALGLKRLQTVILVIAPQMLRNIAAPMGNYFIGIFKSTPYLAAIAVYEAFGAALDIASDTFRYTEPMVVVGAIFLAIALVLAWLVRRLEEHLLLSAKR
ncbi:polar amino acid transport system permease protein [Bosea sp. AK1]|jgi:polar amino acid transport system permease protein|uniref:ectoine/hydroxyectoine ABC transporter permease subunit EhuD n=1 Tax=Bosea sp. AK1 TaxID=2587160 RepID=UPI00114F2148|nr:ectoine/hydroxyectoine ABC transporter permease subunit EhuD [Bosea sp. AK1]TQI77112.1 polar amino acid transport system permease protein [Bosea sp. AK1]